VTRPPYTGPRSIKCHQREIFFTQFTSKLGDDAQAKFLQNRCYNVNVNVNRRTAEKSDVYVDVDSDSAEISLRRRETSPSLLENYCQMFS